jgi:hypothetical protein
MTPNLFPPDFGPPFRNNPLMAGPPPGPIRIERAKLLTKWEACGAAEAFLVIVDKDPDDPYATIAVETDEKIYLRDPLGQINWELAALQEPTGEFYLEAGLYLVVWQPEDATDGHWELLSVGSGCPYGSEEEGSEGSGSEGSGSEEEGSGSEGEGSEPEPSCIREEDVFFATLPVITNPEYILGKDENGCLGWVKFDPCAPCCDDYCIDQTPTEMWVRLSGIIEGLDQNDLCDPGDVENYWNADFKLVNAGRLPEHLPCSWVFDGVSPCDGQSGTHINATLSANQLEIGVLDDTGAVSNAAIFRIALTTPVDCMKALLGVLPNVFGDGLGTVDFTNAVCEVIAVA